MLLVPLVIITLSILSFNEEYVASLEESNVTRQHYNTRCICKCKRNREYPSDTVYIESPFPQKSNCTCPKIVLPKIDLEIEQEILYCLNCDCKYEIRSLIKIQISVAIVIVVIMSLIIYGSCSLLLQPCVKKPRNIETRTHSSFHEPIGNSASYETFGVYDSLGVHTNESLSTSPISKLIFEGKFKRIINMQKRWKEQLEVQRRKIYNSTSFLKE